jgi:hypothetical protein
MTRSGNASQPRGVSSARPRTLSGAHVVAMMAVAALAAGCGSAAENDARPACVDVDVDGCSLAYPAEFPILFDRIFMQKCASAGGTCHGGVGQGGLAFVDPNASYDLLLAAKQGGARVEPGDARCSEIVVRLDSVGHSWSMPPGTALDEGMRCSVRRWIQMGAPRVP